MNCKQSRGVTHFLLPIVILVSTSFPSLAAEFAWPENKKLAISLSYDDALASQLDNAVPVLDKHKFKASFYVFASAPVFSERLNEWRALAANGHELGNHTLYHNCSRKLSGDWVRPYVDLDARSVEHMVVDITILNTLLQAVDGHTQRTFTTPCGQTLAKDGDYLPQVKDLFVAFKGQGIAGGFSILATPSEVSAKQLISHVESAPKNTRLVNILFHGIGGDHLSVDAEEHRKFIDYLAAHKQDYWVDTYLNIMSHVKANGSEEVKKAAGF